MQVSGMCTNDNCICSVTENGNSCCADCEHDATDRLPGACACGHSDCEPPGMEQEADSAEANPV